MLVKGKDFIPRKQANQLCPIFLVWAKESIGACPLQKHSTLWLQLFIFKHIQQTVTSIHSHFCARKIKFANVKTKILYITLCLPGIYYSQLNPKTFTTCRRGDRVTVVESFCSKQREKRIQVFFYFQMVKPSFDITYLKNGVNIGTYSLLLLF